MAAPVPLQWRPPSVGEVVPGRPVYGRTLVAMAGALNHMNGLHARGWLPVSCCIAGAETVGDADDVGLIVGEAENESVRAPFWVPPGVDVIRVAVVALAYETGGAAEPTITVSAYDAAGVAVDAGFDLTRGNGSLPGGEIAVAGEYWLTPFVGENASATLSVGSKEGSVIILRLDTVRCLVVAVFVIPDLAVTL